MYEAIVARALIALLLVCDRQSDCEAGTLPQSALNFYGAIHLFHSVLNDRKSQSRSTDGA